RPPPYQAALPLSSGTIGATMAQPLWQSPQTTTARRAIRCAGMVDLKIQCRYRADEALTFAGRGGYPGLIKRSSPARSATLGARPLVRLPRYYGSRDPASARSRVSLGAMESTAASRTPKSAGDLTRAARRACEAGAQFAGANPGSLPPAAAGL